MPALKSQILLNHAYIELNVLTGRMKDLITSYSCIVENLFSKQDGKVKSSSDNRKLGNKIEEAIWCQTRGKFI